MKRHTIILLLTVISSDALAGNPVKWLVNGADSLLRKMYYSIDYDTAYISRSPGKMGLKAWGSVSGASLRARGDNLRSRLTTDVKGTLSLEFDYYDLAVELATNPTSFKGRNHDYEINFNFYPRRFVFDVFSGLGYGFGSGNEYNYYHGYIGLNPTSHVALTSGFKLGVAF